MRRGCIDVSMQPLFDALECLITPATPPDGQIRTKSVPQTDYDTDFFLLADTGESNL